MTKSRARGSELLYALGITSYLLQKVVLRTGDNEAHSLVFSCVRRTMLRSEWSSLPRASLRLTPAPACAILGI